MATTVPKINTIKNILGTKASSSKLLANINRSPATANELLLDIAW